MNTWIATQNCMKPSNIAPKKVQTLEHCYEKTYKTYCYKKRTETSDHCYLKQTIALKNRPKSWTIATKNLQNLGHLLKKTL